MRVAVSDAGRGSDGQELLVVFDDDVDIVDVDEALAEHPRHPGVHLGDHQVGGHRPRPGSRPRRSPGSSSRNRPAATPGSRAAWIGSFLEVKRSGHLGHVHRGDEALVAGDQLRMADPR
ncbi:MAG: hypothetical protein MZV70_35510 [Desulfobacterales bacterium]|nr:hypothetical protein [Desulfobacterales bacterium]